MVSGLVLPSPRRRITGPGGLLDLGEHLDAAIGGLGDRGGLAVEQSSTARAAFCASIGSLFARAPLGAVGPVDPHHAVPALWPTR